MVDPATLAVLGGSAALVTKILGPTAEYIGDGLRAWAEIRVNNLNAIFSNAESKIGADLDDHGQVSPRVLKELLAEGSYSTDSIGVEYFGGILASSRTPSGEDDRGASWGRLVANLSTYALRAHFVIYSALVKQFPDARFFGSKELYQFQIWIDQNEFISALGVDPDDEDLVQSTGAHVFFMLHQYDLVGQTAWGEKSPDSEELSVRASASPSGAELFLWALGLGQKKSFYHLFQVNDYLPEVEGVPEFQSVRPVSSPDLTDESFPEERPSVPGSSAEPLSSD